MIPVMMAIINGNDIYRQAVYSNCQTTLYGGLNIHGK